MKRMISLLLSAAMLLSLTGCFGSESSQSSGSSGSSSGSSQSSSGSAGMEVGRFDALQTTDEPVTLLIDFHSFTPSVSEEPTEEQPTVFNSSRQILEQWLEDKPNVTVEWSRGKDMSSNATMLEWMNIQLNAGNAPDILFAWGSTYSSSGWYEPLDEVMASPNYYQPGNTVWKDMYPDYLWKDSMNVDPKGSIVAVPSTVYPGPPTVYFYNVEIFDELGITPTKDWDQFVKDMQTIRDAGYIPFDPNDSSVISNGSWDHQFSLRGYALPTMDQWDLDGDGQMSALEGTRGLWKGLFYMETNPGAFEEWQVQKEKYVDLIGVGGESVDYTQAWIDGELAVKERGIWDFPAENSNTNRQFAFGMMPPPIKTSENTGEIQWTEAGPYNPQPMESYNIVKPSLQNRPEHNFDYAVDFLKYTHNVENMSVMVEERNGACMGAIKGCAVPGSLTKWYQQSFPINPVANIPNSSTPDGALKLTKLLENWFLDQITEEEFRREWDKLVYEDLQTYVKENQLDTADWGEAFVPESAKAS